MEEKNLEEEKEPEEEIAPTPEEEVEPEKEPEDIDFKKEFEVLDEKPRTEVEKAKRALFFNAERLKELGGDPTEVLKIKPEKPEEVESVIDRKLGERDARSLAKTEDEFKVIKWWMDNKGLSAEDAYILAHKGKLLRSISEAKRAKVDYASPESGGRKVETAIVPDRSPEEKSVLGRRGMRFNPKTQTYQGKFYEEYYDSETKSWQSRKLMSHY